MALVRTKKVGSISGPSFGTGTYTSASFTPANNSLLVVIVACNVNGGSADPTGAMTITDSAGLTWTPRKAIGNAASWACGLKIWTAPVTTGVSMTVSADCGANNIYNYGLEVVEYTEYDTDSPVGADASDPAIGTDGAVSMTLSAAPASTSDVIAAILCDIGSTGPQTVAAGTGWTELDDLLNTSQDFGFQVQARTGSTSATVGWDDIQTGVSVAKALTIALEIKEAGAGGGSGSPVLMGQCVY